MTTVVVDAALPSGAVPVYAVPATPDNASAKEDSDSLVCLAVPHEDPQRAPLLLQARAGVADAPTLRVPSALAEQHGLSPDTSIPGVRVLPDPPVFTCVMLELLATTADAAVPTLPDVIPFLCRAPTLSSGAEIVYSPGITVRLLATLPFARGFVRQGATHVVLARPALADDSADVLQQQLKKLQRRDVSLTSLRQADADFQLPSPASNKGLSGLGMVTSPGSAARLPRASSDLVVQVQAQPIARAGHDALIACGASAAQLARVGLVAGSYALLSPAKTGRAPQLVRMVACEDLEDSSVSVSPLTASNLGMASRVTIAPLHAALRRTEAALDELLPRAKAARVELVGVPWAASLTDRQQRTATMSLQAFFEQPRALSVGDVFPVPNPPPLMSAEADDPLDPLLLMYRVAEITLDDASDDAKREAAAATASPAVLTRKHANLTQRGLASMPAIPGMLPVWLGLRPACAVEVAAVKRLRATLTPFVHAPRLRSRLSANATATAFGSHPLQATVAVEGQRGIGKATCAFAACARLGLFVLDVSCWDLLGRSDDETAERIDRVFAAVTAATVPTALLLRHLDALDPVMPSMLGVPAPPPGESDGGKVSAALLRNAAQLFALERGAATAAKVVIGTCERVAELPRILRAAFRHSLRLETWTHADRVAVLSVAAQRVHIAPDVSLHALATAASGASPRDLLAVISGAVALATEHAPCAPDIAPLAGLHVTSNDFAAAQRHALAHAASAIGAPSVPNIDWDDIGGLADVKREVLDTIQLPLQFPDLFDSAQRKRSGVLLCGPPGTGKTLLAKAVASQCALSFLSVKGPELLNMYVGESERNIRDVFERARSAAPCVVFFDELDSLAPNRGKDGDSGGVMDRIVSQLLAELDGMHRDTDVFVIGATNRPDLLDPSLLRPGRFDRMLFLGVSDDPADRVAILRAQTRKFHLGPDCDLEQLAAQCPGGFTGADFYALCSEALLHAIKRRVSELEAAHAGDRARIRQVLRDTTLKERSVVVCQDDFLSVLPNVQASVSAKDQEYFRDMKNRLTRQA